MKKIKMNWYPDYWTKEERDLLFKFWRERYSKTIINMSPSGKPAGGLGFFDSEWQSYKYKTFKPVYMDTHVVNENYHKRRNALLREQELSQPADRYRIQLLLEAEKKSWQWWKQINLFKPKSGDPAIFIEKVKERNSSLEMAFKEAFAQLIEYDRESGFALADPDRDLKKQPLTIMEYRNWLERDGRDIQKGSEDDLILENIWAGMPNSKGNDDLPDLKDNFVPEILEEYHRNQERSDRHNNVKRSMTGEIINSPKDDKKRAKVDFNSSGHLSEDIKKFREKYGIVREETISDPNALKVNNDIHVDVNKFDKDLEIQLKDIVTHFSEKKQEDVGAFPAENLPSLTFPPLPKENPYSHIIDLTVKEKDEGNFEEENDFLSLEEINKILSEKNIIKDNKSISVVSDLKENILYSDIPKKGNTENEEGNKDSTSGNEERVNASIPSWEEKDSQDTLPTKNLSTNEKIRRIKRKNRRIFDRNRQLKQIKKSWVSLPKREDDNFWVSTKEKVNDFKSATKIMWDNRVKHLLSVGIPEQKALLKIKSIEFKSLKERILSKRKIQQNKEVFDHVKKVSLVSPKLKRNR